MGCVTKENSARDFMLKAGLNFCSMFDGQTPTLLASDVEFVRKALIQEFGSMPNRRVAGVSQKPIGSFLAALNDDHWKHVRTMISPTFTTGKLKLVGW